MKQIFSIVLIAITLNLFAEKQTKVKFKTPYGCMIAVLYNETPQHRDNFIKLIKEEKYKGILFHRVIKDFMIQTGDINSRFARKGQRLGSGDLGYTIPAEFVYGKFHKKGALAAARQSDMVNPKKESSSCQFYIVQGKKFKPEYLNMMAKKTNKQFSPEQIKAYTTIGGTPHLDDAYTVFGEIVKGLEIVDKIAKEKCDRNDRPLKDIKIDVDILE
jgi:cyclophilin family peptidyl-prolyl cis-trans isomerase